MPNNDPTAGRMSGKEGYIHVVVDGRPDFVIVPFFNWVGTTTRTFDDRTSSRHYSKRADLVFRSSVPVATAFDAEVSGRYNRWSTPPEVIARLYRGNELFRVEFGFSPRDPYIDTYAWIERFEVRNPLLEIVDFTCTIRSEGEFTDLTNPQQGDPPDPWADSGDPEQDPGSVL
jgi:hypothetical protein